MKSIWADILPKPIPPDEFTLAGEDPRDADEEAATTDWPLPPVKAWAPLPDDRPEPGSWVMVERPRAPSLWSRLTWVFR
jgi:hypothetical protein